MNSTSSLPQSYEDITNSSPKVNEDMEKEPLMKQTTLIYVFNPEGEMLLAVKKKSDSGFDVSLEKVNTAGGKKEAQETITECALRELQQEFGIIISEANLIDMGVVRFHFETKKEWDNECHIYKIINYAGKYKDSDEMKQLHYFDINTLPRDKMRESDKTWLPKMINGETLDEDFYHTDEGKVISYSSKPKI